MSYSQEPKISWEYKILELQEAPTGEFQQARLAPRKVPTPETVKDLELLVIREPGSNHFHAEPLYPGPDEPAADSTVATSGRQNSSIDIEISEEDHEVIYQNVYFKPSWDHDFLKEAVLLRLQEYLLHFGKPVIDFGARPNPSEQMLIEIMKNKHNWRDVHDH
ncbi:hypothetical protein GCM10023190_15020 [Enteractinococcus fodinae]|uniref:Uncharacterized protein n=1 Tax=Enteractinococcus fodinae TaxID=684663 RepID=A0ABU2AZP5_9MICC|nr:hypothetical protein [Enteractinococcus fodinae]MDR7346023.1 hypothetical protein [Enteractinococcus fodinae]